MRMRTKQFSASENERRGAGEIQIRRARARGVGALWNIGMVAQPKTCTVGPIWLSLIYLHAWNGHKRFSGSAKIAYLLQYCALNIVF